MSDFIKLVIMLIEVAMVTVRADEIIWVVVMVVAMTRRLGSRQLSLVTWKMLTTAIVRIKDLSVGSQTALGAAPWPGTHLNPEIPEGCHGDICLVRSHQSQKDRCYI